MFIFSLYPSVYPPLSIILSVYVYNSQSHSVYAYNSFSLFFRDELSGLSLILKSFW